jgi:hypothetical protein
METKTGTTQEFNRFPFARDLHEIQPVFPEADFGLGITTGLLVIRQEPPPERRDVTAENPLRANKRSCR